VSSIRTAPAPARRADTGASAALAVAAATAVGLALRLVALDQSLFADELSTYWIVSTNDLAGVVSTVHTDVEITPPLYFLTAWLTTRIEISPELLRAPSLFAGVATIPLTYLVGLRTVGRRAGLVAAVLGTLSPFMVFYSTEARGYAVMMALLLLSTLAMLAALEDRRTRWWVGYAACTCMAVYTHYTVVFALGAQLAWLLWTHPEARKAALMANAGAALAFIPWLSGLRADFRSPTTDIVDSFNSVGFDSVRLDLAHWVLGHPLILPKTPLGELPGRVAGVLLVAGIAIAVLGAIVARRKEGSWRVAGSTDRRLALILAMALSVPVGAALLSTVGPNLFGARYLAASWPALSLALAALLVVGPRLAQIGAVGLVVLAFAITTVAMLEPDVQRPQYEAAASFIDRTAGARDIVIDATDYSPVPPTGIDAALGGSHGVFHVGQSRVQYDPFKIIAPPLDPADVTHRAAAEADGARIYVVSSESVFARSSPLDLGLTRTVVDALPASYRLAESHVYRGILSLAVQVYRPRASPRG
jgi:4-amino-4-deoxy-L-arabinose transferase-like glycosyltransferase